MDIIAIATQSTQSQLMLDVSTAMLKKSLDTLETAGADMIQMMEQSVTPHLGGNIDIRI